MRVHNIETEDGLFIGQIVYALCTLLFCLVFLYDTKFKKKATRELFRSISRKAVGASDCLREKAIHREAAHQKVCYLFRKYRPDRALGELILLAGRLNYIAERNVCKENLLE